MSKNLAFPSLCLFFQLSSAVFVSQAAAVDVQTVGDLQVQGIIESTSGGFKFPDGSTLTTAGLNGLLFNVGFIVDNSGSNTGNLLSGAIKFGAGTTGEGIASQRTAGTNQNGLDFYTNNTARFSILNNGYIGIGNRSPDFPLTVSLHKTWAHARFGDIKPTYIGSNGSWIGGNLYWDGSSSHWRYGSLGEASLIFLEGGGLTFATAPSGTGGSNATPVWGLKLMNGRLRVGDKSDPSETLDVAGNIKASGSLTVAGGSNFSSNSGTAINASAASGMGVSGTATSLGGAGIRGSNTAGGEAVVGLTTSTSGTATGAVVGRNDGPGYGVRGFVASNTSGDGVGVIGQVGFAGSTGRAGRFENTNPLNSANIFEVANNGTGTAFWVNHTGSGGDLAVFQSSNSNVMRISKTGRGFFNGGTQNSGADLAEAFDVEGPRSQYEAGDVLEISLTSDRTVTRSQAPYSNLVAGVYATKPGVLLTEESVDADLSAKVPLGVIGVIPTKVCNENGPIRRGDLLVTASRPGFAMKADLDRLKPGQTIGKALETFSGEETGKIRVLVSVR